MKIMRCTYNELQEQPVFEMEVFGAFAAGEHDVQAELRKNVNPS